MTYGRVYARVAEGVEPAYGDSLFIITSGAEAGFVTNNAAAVAAEGEEAAPTTIAIKGRFLGGVDSTTKVAPVELFNQAQA